MMDIKSLANKDTNPFPLRSSLFWKDLTTNEYHSTWELLKRNWDSGKRARLLEKQIEYNCNFLTFYLYHFDDPNCPVNPFVGCPDPKTIAAGKAQWDWGEIAKWMPYLQLGLNPDIWIVPSIFCGDSREATNNTAFHDMFLPTLVQAIHPYIKALNLGSEMSKTMNKAQMERMIWRVKESWKAAGLAEKPVGVHLQCDGEGNLPTPGNADFIMLETSNHPKNYRDPADICEEIKKAVAKCPKFVLVTETYIFCEEARAREQTRAIAQVPGVWALPGPV